MLEETYEEESSRIKQEYEYRKKIYTNLKVEDFNYILNPFKKEQKSIIRRKKLLLII
tara:strand:- start:457 stop:627 length:171 start_codon:yes stop_codon:yes gene_type:complete